MDIKLDHPYDNTKYIVSSRLICDGIPYDIGDYINKGGNAIVHECSNSRSPETFAIKFQIKTHGTREKRFIQEMKIHRSVKHDHLVEFIGSGTISAKFKKYGRMKTKDIHYVIMDKCEQNLNEFINEGNQKLPSFAFIGQFRGLASGLAELHKVAIHRDIKPTNILIKNGIWKLSDFGLCSYVNPDDRNDFTLVGEKIGPANWMSPESNSQFAGYNTPINTQADVFQLASIFWMIINQKHPTGVLTKDDWNGPDNLFSVLYEALQHCPDRRPKDGESFYRKLVEAIELPMTV